MTAVVKLLSKSRNFNQILVKFDFHQTITIQLHDFSLLQRVRVNVCCSYTPTLLILSTMLCLLSRRAALSANIQDSSIFSHYTTGHWFDNEASEQKMRYLAFDIN